MTVGNSDEAIEKALTWKQASRRAIPDSHQFSHQRSKQTHDYLVNGIIIILLKHQANSMKKLIKILLFRITEITKQVSILLITGKKNNHLFSSF